MRNCHTNFCHTDFWKSTISSFGICEFHIYKIAFKGIAWQFQIRVMKISVMKSVSFWSLYEKF